MINSKCPKCNYKISELTPVKCPRCQARLDYGKYLYGRWKK